MKVVRRNFLRLAAAAPGMAHVKATAPPMAEMVEADIAPVAMSFERALTTPTLTSEDVVLSVSDWMENYIRPQMLELAFEIDKSVYEALGRPDLIGKV